MFFSFVNLVALTWVEVVFSMPIFESCCKVKIPEFILLIFAGMALGQGALTVWDKKK
jgi:membrane protein DedA with SNARE-associated domain